MKSSGVVEAFNNTTGRFSVKCERGDYAVFTLMAPQDPRLGDVMTWDDSERAARMVLSNMTQGIEGVHVDQAKFDLPRVVAEALVDA
jgi:hypothetical protein